MTNVNSFDIKTEPEDKTYDGDLERKFSSNSKVEPSINLEKNFIFNDLNNNGPCYDIYRYEYEDGHNQRNFFYDKSEKLTKKRQYFYCYSKFLPQNLLKYRLTTIFFFFWVIQIY